MTNRSFSCFLPVHADSIKRRTGMLAARLILFGAMVSAVNADVILIPAGAAWKYLDNGQTPANWQVPVYNDSDLPWQSGLAELGYNTDNTEPREATVIGYGGNTAAKYITSYFRHTFNGV